MGQRTGQALRVKGGRLEHWPAAARQQRSMWRPALSGHPALRCSGLGLMLAFGLFQGGPSPSPPLLSSRAGPRAEHQHLALHRQREQAPPGPPGALLSPELRGPWGPRGSPVRGPFCRQAPLGRRAHTVSWATTSSGIFAEAGSRDTPPTPLRAAGKSGQCSPQREGSAPQLPESCRVQ